MKAEATENPSEHGAEDGAANPPFRFWMTRCMAVVMSACLGAGAVRAVERHPSRSQISPFNMAETVQRIEATALRHGLQVFALVDGRGAAADGAERSAVLVLAVSGGGTLVTMDRAAGRPDVPLSLVFRDLRDGSTEIVLHEGGAAQRLPGLPAQVLRDLASLPQLVTEALG
jgi:hypothetical protein